MVGGSLVNVAGKVQVKANQETAERRYLKIWRSGPHTFVVRPISTPLVPQNLALGLLVVPGRQVVPYGDLLVRLYRPHPLHCS